jgi:hypothetical protein
MSYALDEGMLPERVWLRARAIRQEAAPAHVLLPSYGGGER